MRWLVVIESSMVEADLKRMLEAGSSQAVSSSEPIPLSGAETSIEVEGPHDLPARLRAHEGVKGVYPSSDLTLY